MPRTKTFDENKILNKAMHLFWKQGYAATSVQDLVHHLGINRASLYSTYGDKETLFKKAFDLYRKRTTEGLKDFLSQHSDVKLGFSKLFGQAIKEAIDDKDQKGCFVVNTTAELIPNYIKFLDILEKNKSTIISVFHDYLQKGKEHGQLTTNHDLYAIASLLYTFYNGLRVVGKVKPSKVELEKTVEVALSILK